MENKKEKMKIGIDIDDVIAEFRKGFLRYYKQKENFDAEKAYSSYSVKRFFSDAEKVDKEIDNFHYLPELEELDLVEGSKEIVNNLVEKHEVVFITSRPKEHKEPTKRFIKKYFPEDLKIIHSEEMDKTIDKNKEPVTKGDICEKESIDIMIEDNPRYAKDCAERGIFVFILEKPWNKGYSFENHRNVEKIKHWGEALEKLNKMNTKKRVG